MLIKLLFITYETTVTTSFTNLAIYGPHELTEQVSQGQGVGVVWWQVVNQQARGMQVLEQCYQHQ